MLPSYSPKKLRKLFGLLVLYVLLARLTAFLFAGSGAVSFLWVAGGAGLAVLLLQGYSLLPAVFLGAVLGLWLNGAPIESALILALRHTAGVSLGLWLLRRDGRFDPNLRSLGNYLRILLLALFVGLFAAIITPLLVWLLPLSLTTVFEARSFSQRLTGQVLGIVVVMPLVLVWQRFPRDWAPPRVLGEAVLILALSFLVGQVVFLDWLHGSLGQIARGYWLFLFVTWAAVRLGLHGTVLIVAMVAVQGLIGAQLGTGFFARDIAQTQLTNYFFYMLALSAVGMALATYFAERQGKERTIRQWANAFEFCAHGMVIIDARSNLISACNPAFARIFGRLPEAIIGQPAPGVFDPADQAHFAQSIRQAEADGKVCFEAKILRSNGERVPVQIDSVVIFGSNGAPSYRVGTVQDVSERKLAADKLGLAASVFTHAREGIMITAPDGTIIDVNEAFSRITSYPHDEVVGQNPRILSSGRQEPAFYAAMWRDLAECGHWYGEVWNRRKSGEVYAAMQTISAVRDVQGRTQRYVALFSDITAIKEQQSQLEHLAHYDALTTLPNRVLLADRLHQAMAQAQRREQMLAVAYLDLDGFKAVNDTHGHEVGDQLLMTVAARMKQALREGDTLARLGGDEFVAVLLDLGDIAASLPMLTRLLAAAAQPVLVDGLTIQVSASLGVTFYPQFDEDVDADQLLRQADQAMYQAKVAGKNRYHIFDAEQDRSIRGHHESLERIRRALTAREFVLYYQPKVNMRSGRVVGAEALIRWNHPDKGLLPPAVFLPVIEDHPLAVEVGEWVIETALQQMTLWRAAGLDIPVSVNVGARQLQQADFVPHLQTLLAAYPEVRPGKLELEVLETSALEDLARVSEVIEACRAIGVMFALDDFGTGYSSLTYLKRLAVTQLKIDQSFVRDMLDDQDDLAILEGVLGLATAFRRQAIAEGVETIAHGEMLLQLGCELAQGYGIARPMPAAQFPQWAADWRPDPAWADLPAISRDDLPLLFASVEHRAWIVGIETYLHGAREMPPLLDQTQCRLGQWLGAGGLARYHAQPVFKAIEALHNEAHGLAVSLCEQHQQGQTQAALARLAELHALRESLLSQLQALRRLSRL
jgi:diguanylate cyclase (GGDEF)-like protein/PAS domain S-box-containing protein